jgi:L-lactate dehydrogenase complex protein LldF
MGSVLTPLLTSLEASEALHNACTSCGRCAEVCPADIPLPDLLRDLRHEQSIQGITPPRWQKGLRLHAWVAARPKLYHLLTRLSVSLLGRLGRKRGSFRKLPFADGWTGQRDFPAPQAKTFRELWKERQNG